MSTELHAVARTDSNHNLSISRTLHGLCRHRVSSGSNLVMSSTDRREINDGKSYVKADGKADKNLPVLDTSREHSDFHEVYKFVQCLPAKSDE
ncbi:hypothetical protein J6590_042163 [Homalodisca vitripennis]|nr:hypothetical protein J6590_042163 [Homalodisca vitripennis]